MKTTIEEPASAGKEAVVACGVASVMHEEYSIVVRLSMQLGVIHG
jgi:hypothetical protein